jgi:multidrug efflux pump subunit AcrA (membrane-fusion protein)
MAVLEDAVSTLAGVSNVYVIENNKARQQTVTLGTREGNLYELLSGLKGDEILAASNLTSLATGVPVKVSPSGNMGRPQTPGLPTRGQSAGTERGERP